MYPLSTLSTEVRGAASADAGQLATIYAKTWDATYRGIIPDASLDRMIQRHDARWWRAYLRDNSGRGTVVLEADGRLLGYAHYGASRSGNSGDGEIFELYVDPDAHGYGFGADLFEAARIRLEMAHHSSLIVWVIAENTRAVDFYRSIGGFQCESAIQKFGRKRIEKFAFRWNQYG